MPNDCISLCKHLFLWGCFFPLRLFSYLKGKISQLQCFCFLCPILNIRGGFRRLIFLLLLLFSSDLKLLQKSMEGRSINLTPSPTLCVRATAANFSMQLTAKILYGWALALSRKEPSLQASGLKLSTSLCSQLRVSEAALWHLPLQVFSFSTENCTYILIQKKSTTDYQKWWLNTAGGNKGKGWFWHPNQDQFMY